jgi:DNA-directed RNA polymerase specialized sigma24 family protein
MRKPISLQAGDDRTIDSDPSERGKDACCFAILMWSSKMLNLAKKLALRLMGKASHEPLPPLLFGLDTDPIVAPLEVHEVYRRLAAMPIMVREIYLLRVVERLPIDQIAARLAVPRREVIRNLARAIDYLICQ